MSATEIAPGVFRMPITIANAYFVGEAGSSWFLVDCGTPGKSKALREEAEARYGKGAKPSLILLTHGHFDHAGNAKELAEKWGIPIYAHHLERPYLTGRSPYPPKDPTVGGAMAFLSRFFPTSAINLEPHLRELPENGEVPGHPEWRWTFTPGHAPGHVSLYHAGKGILLAGDAFTTVDVDSPIALALQTKQISRPPAPFTCDWDAAEKSVRELAKLNPAVIGCGHGNPMAGPNVARELSEFAENFPIPSHGRYVPEPAQTDERGIRYLPPAPRDSLPNLAAALGLTLALAAVLIIKIKTDREGSAA